MAIVRRITRPVQEPNEVQDEVPDEVPTDNPFERVLATIRRKRAEYATERQDPFEEPVIPLPVEDTDQDVIDQEDTDQEPEHAVVQVAHGVAHGCADAVADGVADGPAPWSSASPENLRRRLAYQPRLDGWLALHPDADADDVLQAFARFHEEPATIEGFLDLAGAVLAVDVRRVGIAERWAVREAGNHQAELLRRKVERYSRDERYPLSEISSALYVTMSGPRREFLARNLQDPWKLHTPHQLYARAFDRSKGWVLQDTMDIVRREFGNPTTDSGPLVLYGESVDLEMLSVRDPNVTVRGAGLGGGPWLEQVERWQALGWVSDAFRGDPADLAIRKAEVRLTLDAIGRSRPQHPSTRERVQRVLSYDGSILPTRYHAA